MAIAIKPARKDRVERSL